MQVPSTSYDIRSLYPYTHPVVLLLVFLFILLVPVVQLLRRTGHHAIWSLFALFPGLNIIAFWVFTFKPWPTDKRPVS
jgi:hypothetical protein